MIETAMNEKLNKTLLENRKCFIFSVTGDNLGCYTALILNKERSFGLTKLSYMDQKPTLKIHNKVNMG